MRERTKVAAFRALELKDQGLTYPVIAERLTEVIGKRVSDARICQMVKEVRKLKSEESSAA